MAFDYLQLPQALTLPFPPDRAQSFVREHQALSTKPIWEDALVRNRNQPPSTPQYRLYKNCLNILFNQSKLKTNEERKKVVKVLQKLTEEVQYAKNNFVEMFLGFNKMIKVDDENYKSCREKSLDYIKNFKEMTNVQRKLSKANQSLIFLKDAMEEAAETYKEAEVFLKKAAKESMWESPERIQNRFVKLMAIKEEIRKQEEKEIAGCQEILNEMYNIQQRTIDKHTLLLAKARHLARLIQDAEEGVLKLESQEANLAKANDRAWRDYSIINMTIYDLTRGIIELKDLNPALMEGSLKERFELIRREHGYNKEVLRRWGKRRRAGDSEKGAVLGPVFEAARTGRLRAEWEAKVARLRQLVDRYRDKPLPDKFDKYFVWLRRRNPQFPESDQLWHYLQQLVKEMEEANQNK